MPSEPVNPYQSPEQPSAIATEKQPPGFREGQTNLLSDGETLPRVLGRFDAITVVVGSIIGSGIFLKASTVATGLGSFFPIMSIWIVIGLVTLCGALALAELAAMLPHAGGPYVYLREAYGRLPAFLWGWTEFWIIRTGSLGALACATVIYGDILLQAMEGNGLLPDFLASSIPLSHTSQAVVALVLTFAVSIINVIGTRWAAWVQNITSVIKVGFLVFLIVAPFVLFKASTDNLAPLWPQSYGLGFWKAMGVAMIAVFWPYDGWINIGPVAEEVKDPQRNVPIALTVGMLIIIAVYLGANISYHLVLPMKEVAESKGVASDVTQRLLGPMGVWFAALFVMCSAFGALNSNLLAGPRIYFAMARDGLFPAFIRQIHSRFQTPAAAILAQMGWSLVLIIAAYIWTAPQAADPAAPLVITAQTTPAIQPNPAGDAFDALTNFVIFGGSIFYAMAVAAVFVLRWKMPDLPRPYKTWGYPFTPAFYLLVFGATIISLLLGAFYETLFGSLLILAGVVVFFIVAKPVSRTIV